MKKLLFVMSISLLTLSAPAQNKKNETDLAAHNLKGNVKSINEITYKAVEKFGDLEKSKKTDRTFWEFNSAGYEVQFVMEDLEEEDDKFARTTKYNDKNFPIELKEEESYGAVNITKVKYNGEQVESIDVTDKKGSLQSRQKNKYGNGQLVQADTYSADGKLVEKSLNSYNTKNQLTKEETFDADGKLTYVATYAYDNKGNVTERSTHDHKRGHKNPVVWKYVYNASNQKIEERNSITGLDEKEIFEYNLFRQSGR